MKGLIFCAGLGTRFKPWTDHHPKALAVINGKSLLQRNVEYLQQYEIRDLVVNVHHFADQIEEEIRRNDGWGSSIMISDEKNEVLETGGGLLKAAPMLPGERFVALNVDILTDLDLKAMISFHQKQKNLATLAVYRRETSRYFLFDETGQMCGWRNVKTGDEKISRKQSPLLQKAFSGVHIIENNLLSLIKQTGKFSIVDVYLDLSASNKIGGFDHTGSKLIDVGKPDSVPVAESMFP